MELRRPLRRQIESKLKRDARNLAVAGLGAIALQLAEAPVAQCLSALVQQRAWGLLKITALPWWVEIPAAVLALDYTLYIWHILTHKVAFLWRFHLVHHVDLDMDATTALRFHFGELTLSVPWRAAQIMLIGVSPLSLGIWQSLLLVSIVFHHSNLRLPIGFERFLCRFVVTPRMHGIHHSVVREEINSNWSSGLSIWDRLHGTLRLDVVQEEITVGVPAYRDPQELTLPKLVVMPFVEQRPAWP